MNGPQSKAVYMPAPDQLVRNATDSPCHAEAVHTCHRVDRMECWCVDGFDVSAGGGWPADGWGCGAARAAIAGTKTSGAGGWYPNDPRGRIVCSVAAYPFRDAAISLRV